MPMYGRLSYKGMEEAFQDRSYNPEREAGGDGHVKDREHDWNKLRIDTTS